MKSGRPPAWNPVATLASSTWTEVVALTSKSRLLLPAAARVRLSWSQNDRPVELLARVEPGSYAELVPWEPVGDVIMRGLAELLAGEAEPDRSRVALIAMDRYLRLTLGPDGRMSLPANLAHHLDAVSLDAVRLVIDNGRLLLWSERAWQNSRSSRLESVVMKLRTIEATAAQGMTSNLNEPGKPY